MKNIEYTTYNALKFQDYALSFQIFYSVGFTHFDWSFCTFKFQRSAWRWCSSPCTCKMTWLKNFNGPLCHFKLKSKCSSGMFKHLGCTNIDTVNINSTFYIHASHNKWIHFSLYYKKCRPISHYFLFKHHMVTGIIRQILRTLIESQYIGWTLPWFYQTLHFEF